MEGFDTGTMTYMATNFDGAEIAAPDAYSNMMMMPIDMLDEHSNFDAHTFPGSDEYYGLPPQNSPTLKRFSSNYEDAYSDAIGPVATAIEGEIQDTQELQESQDAKEVIIEPDHKLLKFSLPELEYVLLDYTYQQAAISLTAELLGLFLADKDLIADRSDGGATPCELKCYRRNIFQVSGTVTLPRALRYILTNQAKQIPILSQELVISATESAEGGPSKMICVPWKTPPTVNAPEEKTEKEPPAVPLDFSNVQELNSNLASFPFHWKRLQFRNATANNGRRKELQQHFIVHLKVMATLATGGKVAICHAKSNPIIVRGRSPRNFQSKKDASVAGSVAHARKPSTTTGRQRRPSQLDPVRKQSRNSGITPANNETPAVPYFDPAEFHMPALFVNPINDQQAQQGAMTAIPYEPVACEPMGAYAMSSPDFARQQIKAPVTQPQKLSLTDDDELKTMSPPKDENPAKRTATTTRTPSSFALQVGSSPDESADSLYEYFPLSLDDWQPPVDAVYRPHVVHHTHPLPEGKTRERLSRMKSKRYFSEDVG